jgi:hypothetical protein
MDNISQKLQVRDKVYTSNYETVIFVVTKK